MEFNFNEFCIILTREGTVWFCLCLRVCIIYIIYLNIYNIFYMYIPHFSDSVFVCVCVNIHNISEYIKYILYVRPSLFWFCLCLRVCIIYIIYLNIYNIFYMYSPHFSRALGSKPRVLKNWKFVINPPLSETSVFVDFFSVYFHYRNVVMGAAAFFPSPPCSSMNIMRYSSKTCWVVEQL